MTHEQAIELWNALTDRAIGVDSDGEAVWQKTPVGLLVTSHGLECTLWTENSIEKVKGNGEKWQRRQRADQKAVALWLREFANKIENAPYGNDTHEVVLMRIASDALCNCGYMIPSHGAWSPLNHSPECRYRQQYEEYCKGDRIAQADAVNRDEDGKCVSEFCTCDPEKGILWDHARMVCLACHKPINQTQIDSLRVPENTVAFETSDKSEIRGTTEETIGDSIPVGVAAKPSIHGPAVAGNDGTLIIDEMSDDHLCHCANSRKWNIETGLCETCGKTIPYTAVAPPIHGRNDPDIEALAMEDESPTAAANREKEKGETDAK
jgi:hypothetical protein